MKGFILVQFFAIILILNPLFGANLPEFDISDIEINTDLNQISLPNTEQLSTPMGAKLPYQEILVRLGNNQQAADISFSVEKTTTLTGTQQLILPNQFTTSISTNYDQILNDYASEMGSYPGYLVGEINKDNHRYAEILLFPVTVNKEGQLFHNEQIEILINNNHIDPKLYVERSAINLLPENEYEIYQTPTNGNIDYVIITSALLEEAMQQLVTYKNESGYVTELMLIEDILSSYTGRDDPEKLREYLKNFYAQGGYYVLMAGDETILPIRYAYPNYATTIPDPEYLQICDLYFADMTGDWDGDGDNIWGERYSDNPDIIPELAVGRLPINTPEEATRYINKLISYETNPGNGNSEYLNRAFFFSSDQMRDLPESGQHQVIASAYPDYFGIDNTNGVESATGDDPSPTNLSPSELSSVFSDGFGIVNVIAHGRSDGFVVKSANYNEWPKELLITEEQTGSHGCFDSLSINDKPAFYYSLACDNGAFDMDQPPSDNENPNMAQSLIGSSGGAIGFVAYSRYGWIYSSYLLQETFFDSLFAHPGRPAIEAMHDSKAVYYYQRDLIYGQNFYGDPTLKVYTDIPENIQMEATINESNLELALSSEGNPSVSTDVILSKDGIILNVFTSDANGNVTITQPLDSSSTYILSASTPGSTISRITILQSIVTSIDDEPSLLPHNFELHQNYPNPFNPATSISFDLTEPSFVNLTIYNSIGQKVKTVISEYISVGNHTVKWLGNDKDNKPVASGVYFYRLETEHNQAVKKMVLLK